MKWIAPATLSLFAMSACAEELASRDAPETGRSYWLREIDGAAFPAQASIRFDAEGTVSGTGPCNSYGAGLLDPHPSFRLGPIRASRAACPELREESRFLDKLSRMTRVEASGSTLVLSNQDGEELLFQLAAE